MFRMVSFMPAIVVITTLSICVGDANAGGVRRMRQTPCPQHVANRLPDVVEREIRIVEQEMPPKVTKWEYLVFGDYSDPIIAEEMIDMSGRDMGLNHFGDQGWELVGIVQLRYFVFKRPVGVSNSPK